MGGTRRYAYLTTRVSGKRPKLLRRRAFEALSTDAEIDSEALRRTGLVARAEATETGEAAARARLIAALRADVEPLIRPLPAEARAFFGFWMARDEVANIKVLVRGKATGQADEWIREVLSPLAGHSIVASEALLGASDAGDVLRQVERTPLADAVRTAARRHGERAELFLVEAAIDQGFYDGVVRRYRRLRAADRQSIGALLLPILDCINLVWLLRYRFTFGLGPGETYLLLAPPGRRLPKQTLQRLARCGDVDEVVAALPPALGDRLQGADTISAIDDALGDDIERLAERLLVAPLFSLGRAFAYLVVRRRQLERLQAILRARNLGLGTDVMHRAIGPMQTAESR